MKTMSHRKLEGRRIVVVGAAGGLGRQAVETLIYHGAEVIAADKNREGLESLRLPKDQRFCFDATREDEVNDFFDRLPTGSDGLVNAQGVMRLDAAQNHTANDFLESLLVNVHSVFLACTAFSRHLESNKAGSVVNYSSVSSQVVNSLYVSYTTSKAAVSQLTRALALEWASRNLRVNALGPAIVKTSMVEPFMQSIAGFEATALSRIPMGRFATPKDLDGALVFLLSEESAFITGQTLMVDGGRTLSY
jgi:NAD(P)-dependent dehydrogenase (short-subunit alcohol dehydrogenase family)